MGFASTSTSTSTSTLLNRLQKLHATELVQLSSTLQGKTRDGQPAYAGGVLSMVNEYLQYLFNVWGNVFRSIMFLSLNPVDFIVVLGFALGCSIILGIGLVMCIILKLPVMQRAFDDWSRKNNRGLSITNAPTNMFRQITQSQVDAARTALEQPPSEPKTKGGRTFNLDVAKLLLQFSALMYERGTAPVLSALAASHAHKVDVKPQSPANDLEHEESKHSAKMPSPSSTMHGLVSLQNGRDASPTQLLADLVGPAAAKDIDERLNHGAKDSAIRDFCRTFGLDYAPVSELNASDSAFAALFWDPTANWIVLAFKGTSPAEYAEWVSDFNYTLVDAGDWLPGFSQVHGGFLERIFPSDVSEVGGIRPWDTITSGIKLVAENLGKSSSDPDAKINLYFTGHSLGCAIASLAYARAALVEKDLGEQVILRDGYIFAAPIVCDIASVKTFNAIMNQNYDMPMTLWRVTNMQDIVATGLPDYGDKKDSRFLSNSLLNFAHLGAEIKMRSKPTLCQVAGWPHITRGLPVSVMSSLPADLVGTLGVSEGMPSSTLRLERLPLMGRFFQHATSFYWDQLQRVGVGLCQWVEED